MRLVLLKNYVPSQKSLLGAYDDEEAAARAYDLAAIKYWGTSTFTNFPVTCDQTESNSLICLLYDIHLLIN